MQWKQWLRVRSRDETALWQMVALVLAGGLVVGVALDVALPSVEPETLGAESGHTVPETLPEGVPVPVPEDSSWDAIEALAARGAWGAVWRGVWREIPRGWARLGPTGLALATGVCWLVFLWQAGQVDPWRDGRLAGSLAGLALGLASIGVTLFLIVWQEYGWGLRESDQLAGGLRYNILGIGLREEAAKLLCGAVLLPWLASRRDELGALLAFACVGLGFAMEENVGYIASTAGTHTLGRLLMPAPFHIAMTGLTGLAAYRACRWPREWGVVFVGVFAAVVLVHGLYDAFLSVPALAEYGLVAMILFVLTMRQFFHELRELRSRRSETVSLTAIFLFCVSLTAAVTYAYLAAVFNWRFAGDVLVHSIVAEAVMVYLFLREMPESMVRV